MDQPLARIASQLDRWTSSLPRDALIATGLVCVAGALSPRRGLLGRALLGVSGGGLLYAAARRAPANSGSHATEGLDEVHVVRSVTVDADADALFQFWREPSNMPELFAHVRSVEVLDATRSRWCVDGPLGQAVEFDSEIVETLPGERIAWRSLPGARVAHRGSVRFEPAPRGHGTRVVVELDYHPPLGAVGAQLGAWLGADPGQQLEEDLEVLRARYASAEASDDEVMIPGVVPRAEIVNPPIGAERLDVDEGDRDDGDPAVRYEAHEDELRVADERVDPTARP